MRHRFPLVAKQITGGHHRGAPSRSTTHVPSQKTPKLHTCHTSHRARHKTQSRNKAGKKHGLVAMLDEKLPKAAVPMGDELKTTRQALEQGLPAGLADKVSHTVAKDRAC